MYTKKILVISIAAAIIIIPAVQAENIFEFILTNNKDLEAKMLFLDKLETCTPQKYHAEPSGIYEIYGKFNKACSVKWTIADCNFPEGVYQKFANVQKHRTIERAIRLDEGYREELKDRNYRYLLATGNEFCKIRY